MKKRIIEIVLATAALFFTVNSVCFVQAQVNGSSTVDITSFGAIGDGRTDDTRAFEQAFQTLQGGGEVIVPKGVYVIRPDVLSVPSGISISGNQAEIIPPPSSLEGLKLFELHGSNISVSGLIFDGGEKIVRGLTIGGGSSHISITDTTVQNFAIPDVPASDCLYDEIPTGIRVEGDCHQIVINNDFINQITAFYGSSQTARGIWINPTANPDGSFQGMSTDITIENSTIKNILSKDNADGIVTQGFSSSGSQNLNILHNIFSGCSKRAIKIQTDGVTVSGNVIDNSMQHSSGMYAGISEYASHGVITNNIIEGANGYYCGVELGLGTEISDIVVEGNRISNGTSVNVSTPLTSIRIFGTVSKISVKNNKLNHAEYGVLFAHQPPTAEIINNSMLEIAQPNVLVQTW